MTISGATRSLLGIGGWCLTILLLGAFVVISEQRASAAALARLDEVASPFTLEPFSSDDEPVALDDFAGRPIVLHFWASWHGDVRTEAPMLERLSQAYDLREYGVAFVGVAVYDAFRPAKDLVKGLVLTYPIGFDTTGEVARAYRVSSVPTTYFIDRNGRLVRKHMGTLSEDDVRRYLDEILR